MFQVGDRVRKRYYSDDPSAEGTVTAVVGRWVHVRHDVGSTKGGAVGRVPPRFDYLAEELEHLNPLLKFASEV